MSDISVPVIDRVLELAPAATFEVDGFIYIDKDKTVTRYERPLVKAIEVGTLTGLADLLDIGFEGYEPSEVIVHVLSHERVNLLFKESDRWQRRGVLIQALRQAPERSFQFNKYMPQEDFVIALRSMFVQDSAIDDLVSIAGNLASQAEVKQQDDGFSQTATVKAGVVRLTEKTINPRVSLVPFRTFLEAVQPASDYIFRLREGNQCALFEADAGAWKLAAIQNIKSWLQNRLHGSSVDGVADIPVIA